LTAAGVMHRSCPERPAPAWHGPGGPRKRGEP
jgi:hypothetical protein